MEENRKNIEESPNDSICADKMHMAEAELSAEDWRDELQLIDCPPRSTPRGWRAVTVAASARLSNRLAVALHGRAALVA